MRFIQLYHRDWDHHGSIKEHVRGTAAEVDKGMAALIKDLKARDMLKDTLILWNGEFGRTPMAQGSGRDRRGCGCHPDLSHQGTEQPGCDLQRGEDGHGAVTLANMGRNLPPAGVQSPLPHRGRGRR